MECMRKAFLPQLLMMLLWSLCGEAALEFEAFRLVQYEVGGELYGSIRVGMNAVATRLRDKVGSLRRTVIAKLEEITVEALEELLDGPQTSGLLIILPRLSPLTESSQAVDTVVLTRIERWLLLRKIPVPVYFAWETAELTAMHESVGLESDTQRWLVTETQAEAQPVVPLEAVNIQGQLLSSDDAGGDGQSSKPVIAIVAHYDTFGAVPSLATGISEGGGSGPIAVLALAEVFARATQAFPPKYNIVFLLSAAGVSNFAGVHHWLQKADSRFLNSISFALCLDGLDSGGEVSLHLARTPKQPETVKLIDQLKRSAKQRGVTFSVQTKKVKGTEATVTWQHELFNRFKVMGGTLSQVQAPNAMFEQPSSFAEFGVASPINTDVLKRNFNFVAEALAAHIYDLDSSDVEVFDGSLEINWELVHSWLDYFRHAPRFFPLLHPRSEVPLMLENWLGRSVRDVAMQPFTVKSEYTFYTDRPIMISAYETTSLWFDAVFAAAVVVYLCMLYVIIKGPRNLGVDMQSLFRGSKPQKKARKS